MARKPMVAPVRGWLVEPGEIQVERLEISNQVTQSQAGIFLLGSELDAGDEQFIRGGSSDHQSDWLVKRIIVDCMVLGLPTALNTSGRLFTHLALVKGDFDKLNNPGDRPEGLTDAECWEGTWRAEMARYLAYQPVYAPAVQPEDPEGGFPEGPQIAGVAGPAFFRWDLSYKGGINIGQDEALALVVSQDTVFQPWIVGDEVLVRYLVQVMVQKRRQP